MIFGNFGTVLRLVTIPWMVLLMLQLVLLGNHIAGNVVSGTQSYGGGLAISGSGPTAVTLQDNLKVVLFKRKMRPDPC